MKDVFSIVKDGVEVELAVVTPNPQQSQEAQIHYRKVFAKALKEKVILRKALEKDMVEQGIWGPEQEELDNKLDEEINNRLSILNKGGIPLSKAKQIALEIRQFRNKKQELNLEKTVLDANTVEGLAENSKFEYLVSQCTVYNSTGEYYFSSLDDYLKQVANDEIVTHIAAFKLMPMLYGVKSDYERELPENKFLAKHKFVNQDLRLINKDGHLIDDLGRLVNELGYLVNDKDELIDENGELVVPVASEPFLDDEGNPIT
jgi:hypothetical protein